MQTIESILFDPVGCLAEFPHEPFDEIASRLFGRRKKRSTSGSRSYWHLLNLMQMSDGNTIEDLEVQAADGASVYEDVIPALTELKAMGIKLFVTSSLSNAAIGRFLEKLSPHEFFTAVWSRDNAQGIKAAPLLSAIRAASLKPERTIFLVDTAEGLRVAKSAGVNPVLMMNDPDEARRLAMHDPAGGIVSLHELPDFIRLVAAEKARLIASQPEATSY
jgi:beta-phosphoglucomutase-like phosphatase (HAD superfamily)